MNFSLRLIKTGSSLMVMLLLATVGWAQPAAPASLQMLVKGTDRVMMSWATSANADGYRLYTSTDSVTFTLAATVPGGNTIRTILTGLAPATQYYAQIEAYDAVGASALTGTSFLTTAPQMVINFPLDALTQDSITEVMSGRKFRAVGQVVITDGETNGLGAPALRYIQDELLGINSYIRITDVLRRPTTAQWAGNSDISDPQLGRSYAFWVKNNRPDLFSIPLSIGKRNGSTVAFKDDSIYVFTDHRFGPDNHSIKAAAPLSDTAWHHIAYVFEEPFTKLYIDGQLVASSDNADDSFPYPYPSEWDVNCCDRDAEIGALFNPAFGPIEYLGGNWNPGVRHVFDGQMARLKFWNYSLSDTDVFDDFAELLPDAPSSASLFTNGVERAIIGWNKVEGVDGYRVHISTDSATYTQAAEVMGDSITFVTISGLTANTPYFAYVESFGTLGNSAPVPVSFTTVDPKLVIDFPLDELVSDSIVEVISGRKFGRAPSGQATITDASSSGLGVPALKFVQDELQGIQTYFNLTSILRTPDNTPANSDISSPLMGRSYSFWIQNANPSAYSIPLSIGKRNGSTVAFQNDSIYVFTDHRFPPELYSIKAAAPLSSTEWHHIAYVFDEPFTKLYVDGVLVANSDKADDEKPYPYPTLWDVNCCDRDAEIGALFNPAYGPIEYLGDTYDPGARNFFNGHMAKLKFWNYAISDDDVLDQFTELSQAAPATASLFTNGVERAIIGWEQAADAAGYRVHISTDSATYTQAAEVTDGTITFTTITGLTANTPYFAYVEAFGPRGNSAPVPVSFTTVDPRLVIDFPLDELLGDSIVEVISGRKFGHVPSGQAMITDAASSGLGIPALKFVQDELQGIQTYFNISQILKTPDFEPTNSDISTPLMGRSYSFWIQNANPSAYSIPLSIGKRNGSTVAFQNDSIYVFTDHRFPPELYSIKAAAPLSSTEWHHIAYVFDEPFTQLYVDGVLVANSDKADDEKPYPYPTLWDVNQFDRDAEIGALFNPAYGPIEYLGDTYDPGVRNFFSGHMAKLKFWNYSLTELEIANQYAEHAVSSIDAGFLSELKVYPNPAQDHLVLSLDHPEESQVTLIDLQGRVLKQATLQGTAEMSVEDLPAGLYLVQVRSKNHQVTQKVRIDR